MKQCTINLILEIYKCIILCLYCVCVLGYDGGSSDSECDGPTMDEPEIQSPLMPDFWLIIQIQKDRLEVFSHSRFAKLMLQTTAVLVSHHTCSEIKETACSYIFLCCSTMKESLLPLSVSFILQGACDVI